MYKQAFLSFRGRSKITVNLLQRLVPSKRCQCRGYSRSTRHTNERANGHDLLSQSNPSTNNRSLMTFAIVSYPVHIEQSSQPAVLLGVAGVAGYARYNDERRSIKKGEGVKGAIVKGPTIGGPFSLINTERQIVTERDLLGHWVLLYFGYTSSPDVGPAELRKLAKAIDILESKENVKLLPVFVTLDPQRDLPSHLKAYLREFDPRIVGLTGSVSATRQMAQEYRVFFKRVEEDGNDYLVETSHNMYLMNPNMEIVRCFGVEYGATELADAIVKELKKTAS